MKLSCSIRKLLTVVLAFVFVAGFGQDSAYLSQQEDRPLAIVRRFKPVVSVNKQGAGEKVLDLEEDLGERLFSGDTLTTDKDGYALVLFMDNSLAKVKPNSRLVLRGDTERAVKRGNTRIDLNLGEIFLEIQPQGRNNFEVSTSRSLASVKGTEFGNTDDGFVWVKNGQVDVVASVSGETVSLFEKMYARVDEDGGNIELGTLSDEELSELGAGYDAVDENLVRKQMIIRFRDANGQIREVSIDYYEKGNN